MSLRTDRHWYFRDKRPGEPRQGDIPTQHALKEDIETFVRETLQNANDAGLPGERPVEVYFRFVRLSGAELDAFKEAMQWEQLLEHLDAASGGDHSLRLTQFIEYIEEEDELVMLIAEDRNTTGLNGTEIEDKSNYTALVRDMQISHKDDTAGGSHGVGKTTLWAFSGISTVLFTSILSDENDDQESPRVVGRTILPDHKKNGSLYEGLGWFGVDEDVDEGSDADEELERPASAWGSDAEDLAEALHLDHYDPDVTGTSAMVLGFSSPLGDIRPDINEVADEFEKVAVKYFWPAISYGQLSIHIDTPDDEEPWEVSLDAAPEVKPFIEAFNNQFTPNEELSAPGDVVLDEIEFKPEDKRDGTETEAGDVNLIVRLPQPSDDNGLVNHVAMFRGAGMVVDYRDMSGAVSGNDFHAVLAAGEARAWPASPTPADSDIETFLRSAEPAAHENWQSTPKLKKRYKRGCVSTVEDLKKTKLRDALGHLVTSEDEEGGDFVPSISRHLPLGKRGSDSDGPDPPPAVDVFDWDTDVWFTGDCWKFEGEIEPEIDEYNEWSATISLTRLGEDNSKANSLSVSTVACGHSDVTCEVDDSSDVADGVIHCETNAGRVDFEGESEAIGTTDPLSGLVGKLRLEIEGEVVEGGEE